MCAKVAYLDKKEAKRALRTAIAARQSGVMCRHEIRFYRCGWCGLWHLTSKPERTEMEA